MSTLAGFRDKLQALINEHSMENGSDTPDFILAEFLTDCLATFDKTVRERERWYSRDKPRPTIAELDAILSAPEGPPVKVMPDGRVRLVKPDNDSPEPFVNRSALPENDDHE